MLTRLITLSAIILSVVSAQQLGKLEPYEDVNQFSEKALENLNKYQGEGVDLPEMIKDMTVYFNMFKARYTNILPVNFRHMLMNNITQMIDELVTPYVDLVVFEDKQYKSVSWHELKQNIKLIFAGRMWFSNIAYFNEQKRYSKLNLQQYNDDIVADMMGSLSYNLTVISMDSPNKKISNSNWDIAGVSNYLESKLSDEIWQEYDYISDMLIGETEHCVKDFFKQVKRKDLLKELEIIADTSMGKHGEQTWEDNFKPFTYTNQPKKQSQQYAYSISYEFPKSCGAAVSRNRAVHPDFENDQKDKVFLQWIETAYDRRDLDHDKVEQEGYEYLEHQLFQSTMNSYWINYFKSDFENTLERKIQRKEYKYLDAMSYETRGNSWVDNEGREYDLDLEDTELDHSWQQNQLLKECLKNSIIWNVDEFFENQENYDKCLRMAPDIIYFDDKLLIQEQQAFQKNVEMYEAFHQHQANINRKDTEDNRSGRRDLKAISSRPNYIHEHASFKTTNTSEKATTRFHQRSTRNSRPNHVQHATLKTNNTRNTMTHGHERTSRRNEQTAMETMMGKLLDLLKK